MPASPRAAGEMEAPPAPASPGAAGETEAPQRFPGIAELPMGISGENANQRESRLMMSHCRSTALGLGFIFARTGAIGIAVWSNSSSLGAFLEEMTPRHSPQLAENMSLAEGFRFAPPVGSSFSLPRGGGHTEHHFCWYPSAA